MSYFGIVAEWMTPFIVVVFLLHVASLAYLRARRAQIGKQMAHKLDHFTHGLSGRPMLDKNKLDDGIRAFLEFVHAVLHDHHYKDQRTKLRERIEIIDEDKSYLQSEGFERLFNFWRALIEVYPLLGILGTVLAIAASVGDASGAATQSTNVTIPGILANFGFALQSTIAGLGLGVVMIGLNAWHEVGFERLVTRGGEMRDTINKVQRELALEPKE